MTAKKKVGPYWVDDSREISMSDLYRIGFHWNDAEERYEFVDYNGTGKEWYVSKMPTTWRKPANHRDRAKQRQAVLKAMITRRDNKRKREGK